jgi:hypothetical protein
MYLRINKDKCLQVQRFRVKILVTKSDIDKNRLLKNVYIQFLVKETIEIHYTVREMNGPTDKNDNLFNHFTLGILKRIANFMAVREAWHGSRFKYFFLIYYTPFY